MTRYFKFLLIRGHMGSGYTESTITFYETGNNLLEAMDKARRHGGVKHSRIPLNGEEISKAEYEQGMKTNAYDRAGCRKYSFKRNC